MLTDQELQSLRNQGNEAEAAADEIAELRAAYALLFKRESEMRKAIDGLRAQSARDATEARWSTREQIAAWLEANGQPGYAVEVRCRDWA